VADGDGRAGVEEDHDRHKIPPWGPRVNGLVVPAGPPKGPATYARPAGTNRLHHLTCCSNPL
jgi:hypothetical protein